MDNKQNTGNPDRSLINLNENYEVEYWSEKFGIKPETLKEAVKAAGNSAKSVEEYLKK